ncbi:MAG: glycosyltransferase N-terminal domain-containing protein [Pseudomonadota bacterium]
MASKNNPISLRFWKLISWIFAVPLILLSWWMHRRMGAEPARFEERVGRGSTTDDGPRVIWFHAASLGEVKQIAPMAEKLSKDAQTRILVTTTTTTGAAWVAQHMPFALHRFAPIDTPGAVSRFLQGWRPRAAIFVEGDFWPRMVLALKARDAPCILLNARDSRTRRRLDALYAALLRDFALVTCRSERVAKEMRGLGVPPDRVHLLPDLRVTLPRLAVPQADLAALYTDIGTRAIWLAASTHAGDEAAVIDAHRQVLAKWSETLLIVAPRHPDRAAVLEERAQAGGLATARRSKGQGIDQPTQVYIADTLSEMGLWFSLSPIAFIGGSFGPEGGHTPYEPAQFGAAILHGPGVRNFADAYAVLAVAGAAQEVADAPGLAAAVLELMQEDSASKRGAAGRAFMDRAQAGSSDHTALVRDVLAGAGILTRPGRG